MRTLPRQTIICIALAAAAQTAAACGYCDEDRIAAVYDHAIAAQALARKHRMAFYAIDGPLADSAAERRAIERVAQATPGVDAASARVSTASAALALAFDPALTSSANLQKLLRDRLKTRRLTLTQLHGLDR